MFNSPLKTFLAHKFTKSIIKNKSSPNRSTTKRRHVPRKSRISPSFKKRGGGDNDVWIEMIATHKKSGKERSYFKSVNTRKKVWDEPPTGASQIVLHPRKI